MWNLLMSYWNKAKYWIIGTAIAVLYLLGYQKGKATEQIKTVKGTLKNVEISKKSRDTLANSERIKRLHAKYKR